MLHMLGYVVLIKKNSDTGMMKKIHILYFVLNGNSFAQIEHILLNT